MNNENRQIAKSLFATINGKIMLLRAEVDMLEVEGNGLRSTAGEIVRRLEANDYFKDPSLVTDASAVVHQKWAEQAQRYNVQANNVAKLLLDKSRQMLDLIQYLKTKLTSLGFDIPDVGNDPLEWDEFIFEAEECRAESE